MKNKKKKNIIREAYLRSWNYIKECDRFVYSIVLLFLSSSVVGFLFSSELSFLYNILRNLIEGTRDLSASELVKFIFLNNAKSSLTGMLGGIILGIVPIFVTVLNGLILGYVHSLSWQMSGISDFWRLLPHGIFELSAVFLSLGMGMRLGTAIFENRPWETLKMRLKMSILVFLLVVIPLLMIAAIIEGALIAFGR